MPKHNPREFLKGLVSGKRERWLFTAAELENPAACRRDDVFEIYVNNTNGVLFGHLVKVQRDGTLKTSGLHSDQIDELDGSAASDFMKQLAQDESDETGEAFKYVFVKDDGSFLNFAPPVPPKRPGDALAESLLEAQSGAARDFFKGLNRPKFYHDLIEMGWRYDWRKGEVFRFRLTGFYVQHVNHPGQVACTISPYDASEDGRVGVSFFDMTGWNPPSRVYYGPWEVLKPALLGWMKNLKFNVPEDDSQLPTLRDWFKIWAELKKILKTRMQPKI